MIWLWSCFVLVLLSSGGLAQPKPDDTTAAPGSKPAAPGSKPAAPLATTTQKPTTTTQDVLTKLDEDETRKILNLLSSCEGRFEGNSEFIAWIRNLHEASQWGKDKLNAKIAVRIGFLTYNNLREKLEERIQKRIDEIDILIPNQKRGGTCSRYYQQQKSYLKDSLKLSNDEKLKRLVDNSINCRIRNDYVDYYESDYYFNYDDY